MAKNYENQNKTGNYSADKTTSRNAVDSQNCGKNSSANSSKNTSATKHPVHTTENRTNTPTKNNIKQNFRQLFSLLKVEDRLRETAKPVFI